MSKPIIIDGVDVSGCENYAHGCNEYLDGSCSGHNCYYKQLQRLKAENEKLRAELEEEIEKLDKKENELRAQLGKNNHLYKENLRKIKNDLLHINTEIAHIAQDKLTHHIIETALRGLNSGLADLIRSIKDV